MYIVLFLLTVVEFQTISPFCKVAYIFIYTSLKVNKVYLNRLFRTIKLTLACFVSLLFVPRAAKYNWYRYGYLLIFISENKTNLIDLYDTNINIIIMTPHKNKYPLTFSTNHMYLAVIRLVILGV